MNLFSKKQYLYILILGFISHSGIDGLTVSCGEGWSGYSESTSCYKFLNNEETFDEAQLYCQNLGSHLAIIGTKKEREYISLQIGQLSHQIKSKEWWIGLKGVEERKLNWTWIDESPLNTSVTPWASHEPDDAPGCGTMDTKGYLHNTECPSLLSFVCERSIGAPIMCENGWEHHGDSCYKFEFEEVTSYEEARDICLKKASDIVVINSFAENKFLHSMIDFGSVDVWIGIRENVTSFLFEWVDGTPDSGEGVISNWNVDMPQSLEGQAAGFASPASNQKWNTRIVFDRIGYICEKEAGAICQFDSVPYLEECYVFNYELVGKSKDHDWTTNKEKCKELGMKMVVIEDSTKNEFLLNTLSSLEEDHYGSWLGYYEIGVDSRVFERLSDNKTTDESDVFTNFRSSVDYDATLYDALFINGCKSCTGTWNARRSDVFELHPMCMFDRGTVLDVTGIMHPKIKCPPDWVEFGGFCYLFVIELKNWGEAQSFCQSAHPGGNLASIHTDFENDFLVNLVNRASIWTGYNDRAEEGHWVWIDKTVSNFSVWEQDEPSQNRLKNCGQIYGGLWFSNECSKGLSFVCKVKGISEGGPILPETTTVPPTGNCGTGYNWMEDTQTGMCYNFVQGEFNFEDARSECLIFGGNGTDLVSLTSQDEEDFIRSIGSFMTTSQTVIIGLTNDNIQGGYEWADKSPVNFIYWQENEPSSQSDQKCVEMIISDGRWKTFDCQVSKAILCKKKGKNYVEPPVPEPDRCQDGWDYFLKRCYSYAEKGISWSEANQECQLSHPGANLVSIRSQLENDFVTKNWKPLDKTWIGGLDEEGSGLFSWTDNSRWDYTNWDEGEPTAATPMNCIYMVSNEKWHDYSCDETSISSHICAYEDEICPENWTLLDGSCWYVPEEHLDWSMALDYCRTLEVRSDLASIHKESENNLLSLFASSDIWIGLTKKDDQFMWSNNDAVDFLNWDEGEPSESPDLNCSFINGNRRWQTSECSSKKKFACQKKSNLYFSCPPGWSKYQHTCYHTQDEDLSWDKAHQGCLDKGADLVSINSIGESNFIKAIYGTSGKERNFTTWIGLSDAKKMTFAWSDGSRVSFSSWNTKMPSKELQDKTDCAFLDEKMKYWSLVNCESIVEKKSICEKPAVITNIPPEIDGCVEGQLGFEGSCFDVHLTPEMTEEADVSCRSDRGHLITILSENDQAFISSYLSEYPGKFHLALYYDKETQSFFWRSGEPVLFTNWGVNQPDLNIESVYSKLCVYMDEEGYWYMEDCNTLLPFICELPREGFTTLEPTTPTTERPDLPCIDSNWIKYNGHCYRQIEGEFQSFDQARSLCQSFGGDLVILNDDKEYAELLNSYTHEYASWIGLRAYDEGYEWIDGSSGFITWAAGYPDSHGGSDLCIANQFLRGMFNYHCDSLLQVLCEMDSGIVPPTTEVPPTLPPVKKCSEDDDGWIMNPANEEFCYMFVKEDRNWHEAAETCKVLGGRLTSIHNIQENTFITLEIGHLQINDAWIGLNDLDTEGSFQWHDESGVNFEYWAPNEPSNSQSFEGCGLLHAKEVEYVGTWDDQNCGTVQPGYVCIKPKNGVWTTPEPTPQPEGHCPPDHKELSGYCYLLDGLLAPLNWTDARDKCASLGKGYSITSIHSLKENSFIASMLGDGFNTTDAWIGMYLTDNSGKLWQDQSPVDFTFFTFPAEENSAAAIVGKGENIDKFSTWDDFNPQDTLPYICKTKASTDHPNPPPKMMCEDPDHSDFVSFNNECYFVSATPKSWHNAQQDCQNRKANLVSILDRTTQFYLINEIQGSQAWIGLSNIQNHQHYSWIDGNRLQFVYWADGAPVITTDDTCVKYNTSDAKWYQESCDKEYEYVCKYTTIPPSTPSPLGDCPVEFDNLDLPDFCHLHVHDENQAVSFNDALAGCVFRGGHLVSIHDGESNKVISEYSEHHFTIIGLYHQTSVAGSSSFEWADGSPNDGYYNWADFEPDQPEVKGCVVVDPDGKWLTFQCDAEEFKDYVCHAQRIPLTTTSMMPTQETTPTTTDSTTTHSEHSTTTTTHHTDHTTEHHPTTTHDTTTTSVVTTTSSSGLSSGGIAAIVITFIILLGVSIGAYYIWRVQQQRSRLRTGLHGSQPATHSGFENVGFNAASETIETS